MNNIIKKGSELDISTKDEEEIKYIKAGEDFLNNQKESTRRIYRTALNQFFKFAKVLPSRVVSSDITNFKNHLKEKGLSNSTICNKIAAISAYYQYLMEPSDITGEKLAESNPVNKKHRRDIKVDPYENSRKLSLEEFQAICSKIDTRTIKGKRDFAILNFYVFTGRRRSEIAGLTFENIYFENDSVFYKFVGKGGKKDKCEIVPPVWNAIQDYLEASKRDLKDDSALFVATKDNAKYLGHNVDMEKPLSGEAIQQMIKHYSKKAGLKDDEVTLHGVRHLFAELRQKLGDRVEVIQEKLGHSHLNTTQIYLKTLENKKDNSWKQMQNLIFAD